MPALPVDTTQIVITASRLPAAEQQTAASAEIIDSDRIERLGEPLVANYLRLTPSIAVASSGPLGSFTEVRIRGAENNHTLLFIDGIRANDPASGDFARFELLNADLVSRIEVIRGPQSALWGSDAIGGVVSVNGADDQAGYHALLEGGSFDFLRGSGSIAHADDRASLAAAVGFQRSAGIDSFGAPGGDKDGFSNRSARLRGTYALAPQLRAGLAAFALAGRSQFDGYSPTTFERSDTLDNSRNRLAAARAWIEYGDELSPWGGRIAASLLGSSNRNFLADDPINRTRGSRRVIDAQVQRRFAIGGVDQVVIVAAETERETFHARGVSSGLVTDQDRSRSHQAITAEWRASTAGVTAGFVVRRDIFNRFADTTTLRAGLRAELGGGYALAGSYAEGMAQPTFFDLYGTFPNNFVGNPDLGPESSRGYEASIRYRRGSLTAALTGFRQRLHREIVDVFDFATFLSSTENSSGTSRRSGVEAEVGWRVSPALRLAANYAFLDATQPDASTGLQLRERRRPKHSGSVAADGGLGRWTYGASIAYAGSHLDVLEVAPFGVTRVDPYWIASARVAYAVRPGIDLFVRGSNLLDSDYEEVAGYRTEGRGLFVGIRLADRRSSP